MQLNMTFDAARPVARNLREGTFSIFLECPFPAASQPLNLAAAAAIELARTVNKDDRISALVVQGPDDGAVVHDPVEIIGKIQECGAGDHIVVLAGSLFDRDGLRAVVSALASSGIGNFVVTSGRSTLDHPMHPRQGPLTRAYFDSVDMIPVIREQVADGLIGAVVNPFKYHPSDAYLQYFKMMRKLGTGANFLIAQAGWDMKKYQELQWFLRSRQVSEPVIARLRMVSPKEVAAIVENHRGGLVLSREFAAQLQRESDLNEGQAFAAQVRRLALQACGCRLFGYSGVQIGGLAGAQNVKAVIDRVFDALDEFNEFETWLEAWNDFHQNVEMAPSSRSFYIFKDLMSQDQPEYDPDKPLRTRVDFPEPEAGQKVKLRVAEALGLDRRRGMVADGLRKILCGGSFEGGPALARNFFVSPDQCPKRLVAGPCGDSHPDGTCEFGHRPCIFHQVLANANWRQALEELEKHDPGG